MSEMPEATPELANYAFAAIGQLPEQVMMPMLTGVMATIMDALAGECSDCTCSTCISLRGHMQGIAAIRQTS